VISASRRKARIRLALAATVIVFGLMVARLASIQLLHHDRYKLLADAQHTHRVVMEARRGRILDRNGFLLAGNRAVVTFEVYWPSVPQGEGHLIDSLAERLGDRALVGVPVDRRGRNQIIARDIPYEDVSDLLEGNLPLGVNWTVGSRRTYPLGDLAASVVGRCRDDALEGLEGKLNTLLAGEDGQRYVQRSAYPGLSMTDPEAENRAPRDGVDVMLTIDSRFQCIVQRELAKAVQRSGSRWGSAVVVDPSNGDVLAMGNCPVRAENGSLAMNYAVQGYHEPGSTFKVVTLAACLEEGAVTPSDTFDCSRGQIAVADRTISDCHRFGRLSVEEIFSHSSNVGTIKMANLLEDDVFYDYCRRFGFGSKTGVELPGESEGILKPPDQWSGVSKASIAIGQEVTVTPLQLAMAYSAIANGGILYQPRLVAASFSEEGWRSWATFPLRRVLSEQTCLEVRRILMTAVREGTGSSAQICQVPVAGKTGTAERLSVGSGEYLSAFVGMLPAHHPRVVVVVVMDSPDSEYRFGSALAAPVFREVVSSMLATEPEIALGPHHCAEGELAAREAR
jgi:cell division protein FtsI (penicillin-binding protein 3)